MKDKNLPVLFLHKNKKRGDLVGNGMGLGLVTATGSGSLARCQKQKYKRLWTDYSRLDIMHHLRYDGTYRDMFRKDLSMAAECTAILSTAR